MLYKCKNCGGELHFDPTLGKLKCDFCDAVYDVSEYENEAQPSQAAQPHMHTHPQTEFSPDQPVQPDFGKNAAGAQEAAQMGYSKATDDSTDNAEDLRLFACPHCGAEVVTDKDTVATNCVFCGTPLVLKQQMEDGFQPEMLIPFQIDRAQIGDLYEQYIASKPFYPDEYSKANVIEKIRSVYLPFWLYSMDARGDLRASGEKTWTRTTNKWIITEHDVYAIDLAGGLSFEKVPVVASQRTPRDAMDAMEPFDYSKMVPFNTGYLPGFLAQRYDADADQCLLPARNRAETSFNNAMVSTLTGYENVKILDGHMDLYPKKPQYVLMPSYMLFMDYDHDEDKLIAVNGQTGKIVGNIPIDKHKRNRFFLIRFIGMWLIAFVILILLLIVID